MPKGNTALMEQRITEIYKLLLMGASRAEILQHATKKQWNVEIRTIDDYIARATKEIKKKSAVNRDYTLGVARERLRTLYLQAMTVQDLKTALAVQKEINTLEGLYPTLSQKIDLTSNGKPLADTRPVIVLSFTDDKDDNGGIGD